MNRIFINQLNREFDLELCKVNKHPICSIPKEYVKSITRSLNETDKMELTIPKIIQDANMNSIVNPLWEEMKDERLICLNKKDYFVIKTNTFNSSETVKNITAYSREYKLGKMDMVFEDIVFMLVGEEEENEIYSLNNILKEETGWSFGHIDDTVRFSTDSEGNKVEKVRLQTSVNKRWLDYVLNDISENYNCVATFDTDKKQINLYDENTVGENIQLYLSNDNYIKSLSRTNSSEDIVTRLTLIGGDEMNIVGATVTGYPYIEDYSYFMENGEMSEELISHLTKYYEMVEIRTPIWEELVRLKQEKSDLLRRKKSELFVLYEEISALKSIKEVYSAKNDVENEALTIVKISEKVEVQTVLEIEIRNLEEDIENLNSSILEINLLCKRETATDQDGNLIFNEDTLEELKEFIYSETYSNDSFLEVEDLLNAGKRELSLTCYPTVEYSIDVKNFMNRIIDNEFRIHWNGELGLGDIVILHDEDIDKEVFLFVTEYTQNPSVENSDEGLIITLSNKKYKDKNIRTIADKIKEGSLAMSSLKRKLYLLNEQKYNRINMKNYEKEYI